MKTKKSLEKRIKITAGGKLLRRHQLAVGHLRRKKTKGALKRYKRLSEVSKGEAKKYRKLLGLSRDYSW